jgi:hypothetical protein
MKTHVKLMFTTPVAYAFRLGDEIVLAQGTYQGTLGVFLRLGIDVNWAEIEEQNGRVRSHPVAWLALVSGIAGASSRKRCPATGSPMVKMLEYAEGPQFSMMEIDDKRNHVGAALGPTLKDWSTTNSWRRMSAWRLRTVF